LHSNCIFIAAFIDQNLTIHKDTTEQEEA